MPVAAKKVPVPSAKPTRGERNHNPGNIRRIKGMRWQGEAAVQLDREFVTFSEPKWGLRALARCLLTYFDDRYAKDGSKIDCVADIIERWAPPSENDTPAYIRAVAKEMGVDPKVELDLYDFTTLKRLVIAIVRHENGRCQFSDAEIDAGLIAAGLQLPKAPVARTAETAAIGVGTVAGIAAVVPQLFDLLQLATERTRALTEPFGLTWLTPAASTVVVAAILVLAYRLYQRRQLTGA